MSATFGKVAGMEVDIHGDDTTEVTKASQDGSQHETQEQPKMTEDWKAAIAKRDGRIAELEAQVAAVAKSAATAETLRGEIAKLKAKARTSVSSSSCASRACAT